MSQKNSKILGCGFQVPENGFVCQVVTFGTFNACEIIRVNPNI